MPPTGRASDAGVIYLKVSGIIYSEHTPGEISSICVTCFCRHLVVIINNYSFYLRLFYIISSLAASDLMTLIINIPYLLKVPPLLGTGYVFQGLYGHQLSLLHAGQVQVTFVDLS